MSDTPDIRVSPVQPAWLSALLALRVADEQRAFVGAVADQLADIAHCPGSEAMAILRHDVPIGFYRIETRADSIAGRAFAQPTLGLRAFFIDQRWQGQGLGQQALAALLSDLATGHPVARQVALTVNVRNVAAIALYRRAGFVDTGELYHGGPAGPQHLLLYALPA
jgi:RimJ/RimL family protein N-acetyltransferase